MHTLNCKGKLLLLEKPVVMGILNITPDSFYKGFLNESMDSMLELAAGMIANGASVIDIGGQSTRPGSIQLSIDEELKRVVPVIEHLHKNFPEAIFSIDTYHSQVAEAAVNSGASMVNDISSGDIDEKMLETVAALKVPYISMHMQGTPANMQNNPQYEDVTKNILDYFIEKISICKKAGIHDVIIDPGFGFGKTLEHNYSLLKNLSLFKILEKPVLAGVSRKSMIYKLLKTDPANALNGTTVLNTLALQNGASILRVHDVKEAKELIEIFSFYMVNEKRLLH